MTTLRIAVTAVVVGLAVEVAAVAALVQLLHTPLLPPTTSLPAGVHDAADMSPAPVALTPVPLGPDSRRPLVAPSLLIPYIDRGPR